MFKNDERYWDINLLNKWFAISSIVFLLVLVWIFIDDNDDEFKEYQKEFRKLQIEIAETKLNEEKSLVEGKSEDYELELARAVKLYDDKSDKVKSINSELGILRAGFYKVNLRYAEKKAKLDVLKFELESANLKDVEKAEKIRKNYKEKLTAFNEIKVEKEQFEIEIGGLEKQLKGLKADIKIAQDERDRVLKKVDLAQNKLNLLDRSKMSFMNKIGDIVRDLPILDFMDPYYKVKQTVVKDVLYDVNFAAMPAVDRCTSCHLGIANPDFKDVGAKSKEAIGIDKLSFGQTENVKRKRANRNPRTDESVFNKSTTGFRSETQEFADADPRGRFPANVMHDGLDESWAKYFYCPKTSKSERNNADKNTHPTVKPVELMKYLCRLVTPKGGVVLDPFMGSGSTGMAAKDEGFDFIGIEKDEEYFKICESRITRFAPLMDFM